MSEKILIDSKAIMFRIENIIDVLLQYYLCIRAIKLY